MDNISTLVEKAKEIYNKSQKQDPLVQQNMSKDIISSREDVIKSLAHTFLNKRLKNSEEMESSKSKAIDKLKELIPNIDNPMVLMSIIEKLDEQAGKDFDRLLSTESENINLNIGVSNKDNDNIINRNKTKNVSKDVYRLLDVIVNISESLVNKTENPVNVVDGEFKEVD